MLKTIKNVEIKSIACALPPEVKHLTKAFSEYGKQRLDDVQKITGIKQIRQATDQTASDLCVNAAHRLLCEHQKNEIDGIIFVSQTADYILPSTSTIIQEKLGLSSDIFCLDVASGCTGYINGLLTASSLISSMNLQSVLLLVGDTTTKLVNKNDHATAMLFGDAGSATILKYSNDKSLKFNVKNDGSHHDKLIVWNGGSRNPINTSSQKNGGYSTSDNFIFMDGMKIFEFAINEVPKMILETLGEHAIELRDLDLIAVHQANKLIVDTIAKKLNVGFELVPFGAENLGNTGSVSIPLLLCTLPSLEKRELNKVLLCGFGAGLSWGATLADLSDTEFIPMVD